jgi:hypothetical protein
LLQQTVQPLADSLDRIFWPMLDFRPNARAAQGVTRIVDDPELDIRTPHVNADKQRALCLREWYRLQDCSHWGGFAGEGKMMALNINPAGNLDNWKQRGT